MEREKEIPEDFFKWLENQKNPKVEDAFDSIKILCTMPDRAVKMRVLDDKDEDQFRTVIIPSIDICVLKKNAILKKNFLKRDALYFFLSGTGTPFPYGHVFSNSGSICLGNLFVPSAVPKMSPAMPLETLFFHNDRNLSHGGAYLYIEEKAADMIKDMMKHENITLSKHAKDLFVGSRDALIHDGIWCLSADVADQRPLPEAIAIMTRVYDIIFRRNKQSKKEEQHE